ncbi:MAG TPA: MjaI family restriction endonuclease [bacterium]|nr:MjaI family restriction endonuclease [bacterium]
MPKIKIKNEEIFETLIGEIENFPKYTSQIINLANQNAQGTRPSTVGQMSDLIQEFEGKKYEDWADWYKDKMPTAIDNATDKILDMIHKMRDAFEQIDRVLVRRWVCDLLLKKTFVGLRFQEGILEKIAELKGVDYRLAKPEEEAVGIDGFIGNTAVSIKPETYEIMNALNENIDVHIIYYVKHKDGITVEYDL